MFWQEVGDDVEALAKAIEDTPEQWVQGDYRFLNINDRSISIWTANGTSSIRFNGDDAETLNMKEKKRIQRAIHVCKRKQIQLLAKRINSDD